MTPEEEKNSQPDPAIEPLQEDVLSEDQLQEDDLLKEEDNTLYDVFFHEAPTVEMEKTDNAVTNCILGMLSPGTFLSIGNHVIPGITLNLFLASLFIIGPLFCVYSGIFPIPVFIVSSLICASIWIYGIYRVFVEPPRYTSPFQIWGQMGLSFLSFWAPFLICFYVSATSIIQRTWMGNDTMLPGMERGDIILVDRHEFWNREPNYGDLVLIEEAIRESGTTRHRAFFGRIIARPGDSVQLYGIHPVVNGKSLDQYLKTADHDVFDHPIVTYEVPFDVAVSDIKTEPARWYPILHSNQLLFSQTNSVTLEPDYYYVLEDNRDSSHERVRVSYGSVVHISEIHGQPRYVLYNNLQDHPLDRYGIRLR